MKGLFKGYASNANDVECRDYHDISYNSSEWICNFMNTTENCQIEDGFINYLVFAFCNFDYTQTWIPIIIMGIWLFFLFVGLGVTADTFFCPSLRVIADSLKLSQNIAGVTFLAFGNGAPDVFSAIAAIGSSKNGDAGLAFGALFGAGVFVSTVIVGMICFIKPFYSVQRPLLRDIIFFMIAGFWAFYVVWDGRITLFETLGFLGLYVIYILVVCFGRYINQKRKMRRGDFVRKNDFSSDNKPNNGTIRNESYNRIINEEEGDETENDQQDDSLSEENLTRPLLSNNHDESFDADADVEFTYKSAFTDAFSPIHADEWTESNNLFKIMHVVKAPVLLVLKLTIPLVDYEVRNHNWNKVTVIINCLTAPLFMVFATKVGTNLLFDKVPIWSIALALGVVLAILTLLLTDMNHKPKLHWIFAYLGFFVSVVWIYSIANEIVNLLTAFGVILNISNTILGLTFLAWGNSLSDLVADVFSAKRGFPNMGMSACFGGPLFNILLGIGIPFTAQCIKNGEQIIQTSFLQDMLALFLGISLCSTLLFIPFNNFYFSRRYGIYLIFVYAVFLTVCILIESDIIKSPL